MSNTPSEWLGVMYEFGEGTLFEAQYVLEKSLVGCKFVYILRKLNRKSLPTNKHK